MAFDAALHDIDPVTGYMVHKDTGLPAGLVPRLPAAPAATGEYPKWVVAHKSHVDGDVAPEFDSSCRPRNGEVMVLVQTEDDEARALAEKLERHDDGPALVEQSNEAGDDLHG